MTGKLVHCEKRDEPLIREEVAKHPRNLEAAFEAVSKIIGVKVSTIRSHYYNKMERPIRAVRKKKVVNLFEGKGTPSVVENAKEAVVNTPVFNMIKLGVGYLTDVERTEIASMLNKSISGK